MQLLAALHQSENVAGT